MTAEPPAPRRVFTPEWVAAKEARYGRSPPYARPFRYDLWTADRFQARRDATEAWVDALSEREREEVITRLRTDEHFDQTSAELATAWAMKQLGYELQYEAELVSGLTPDWCLRHASRQPFVIEVVSSNPSDGWTRCERAWDQFNHRLRDLPGNAILSVRSARVSLEPVHPPESRRQKEVVRTVGRWLANGRPGGDKLVTDGILVEFVGSSAKRTHNTSYRTTGLWVDGAPLRGELVKKASKYRPLVRAVKQPFMVVVVPDFFTGRGLDEVANAVFGPESGCTAGGNGLFAEYPTLSAVALGTWAGYSMTFEVLRNAGAAYPLPDDALAAIPPGPPCRTMPTGDP